MKNNILIFGGDKRQLYLAKDMKQRKFNVEIFGFSEVSTKLNIAKSLKEGIQHCDILILPMPVTRNNVVLNTPLNDFYITLEEIYQNLSEQHYVFGGMLPKEFYNVTSNLFDYSKSEELILKNAYLTSEAVLEIIISSVPYSILNSEVLILGYGRIGKALADMLCNLGANVTATMRNEKDFAMCDLKKITPLSYDELKNKIADFQIIVNTVPYEILNEKLIKNINKETFVIDLASGNGGCDFKALSKCGIKHIHALGLPGKFSPQTSGKIISDVIIKQLEKD